MTFDLAKLMHLDGNSVDSQLAELLLAQNSDMCIAPESWLWSYICGKFFG
jgi:hypothetical protein